MTEQELRKMIAAGENTDKSLSHGSNAAITSSEKNLR